MFIPKINLFASILRAILLISVPIALISCSIFNPKPKPGLVEPKAAVPADFLFSWHAPYNKGMDTPVRVYYNEVSLEEIFKNAPLIGLSYNFIKKPKHMPLVSIVSILLFTFSSTLRQHNIFYIYIYNITYIYTNGL